MRRFLRAARAAVSRARFLSGQIICGRVVGQHRLRGCGRGRAGSLAACRRDCLPYERSDFRLYGSRSKIFPSARRRSHDASRFRGEEIERLLFAGRVHESGSRPLRAQDHRGRDVLLCCVSLLDWPGIHTCFLTCYIVSLETTAETIEKLTLRISGCLIGTAAGYAAIVFLTPSLTSIGDLLAVVFVGTFASAWVAAGSPRISYAGFQIAFAFLLCAIQGAGPSFDLVTARDRIIGVLFGILVVYLVFASIWPVSVAKRIDRGIGDMMRRMAASLTAGGRPSRGSDMSELQQMLGGVEEDLKVARYEPLSTRPPNEWLERRRQTVEAIGALLGMAWLAVDDNPSLAATTGTRLKRLADRVSPPDPEQLPPDGEVAAQGAPPTKGPEWARQPFREMMERRLEALEKIAYTGLRIRDRREDHASP